MSEFRAFLGGTFGQNLVGEAHKQFKGLGAKEPIAKEPIAKEPVAREPSVFASQLLQWQP